MLIEFVISQIHVSAFNSPVLGAWTSLSICLSLRFESTSVSTATCSHLNHFALTGYNTELCVWAPSSHRDIRCSYSQRAMLEVELLMFLSRGFSPHLHPSTMVTRALVIKRIHTSASMSFTSHSEDSFLQIRPCTVTQLLPMRTCSLQRFPKSRLLLFFSELLQQSSLFLFSSVFPLSLVRQISHRKY